MGLWSSVWGCGGGVAWCGVLQCGSCARQAGGRLATQSVARQPASSAVTSDLPPQQTSSELGRPAAGERGGSSEQERARASRSQGQAAARSQVTQPWPGFYHHTVLLGCSVARPATAALPPHSRLAAGSAYHHSALLCIALHCSALLVEPVLGKLFT